MNLRPLLLTFLLLSQMQAAHSADENGLFAIRGAGLLKCADYVREREAQSDAYAMIGGWLDGYITAINELSAQTFDIVPLESTELLTVLIDRHCRQNSDDLLYAVTNTLLARLYDQRLTASSPYEDVRVGPSQMRLYADTIKRLQSALRGLDLLEVDATGKWNKQTETALAAYQESVGYEGSGFPDQATIWRLLRSAQTTE